MIVTENLENIVAMNLGISNLLKQKGSARVLDHCGYITRTLVVFQVNFFLNIDK